ncbi:protein N-terminal asparagine amidohydrolase-like [Babylonia areolata]|uniref:protein N-terminal asparagine amidohydrolase-like n=1 Tax=Babylonia areolata TaxID=304850 RepID=UPI003FD1439E
MPLHIQNRVVHKAPSSVKDFFHSYNTFQDASKQLTKHKPEVVGPKGLLYVGQREYGGTTPDDDVIKIIGSEDATTCHIGVLRHTGSGATSVLHFDGSNTQQGLHSMIKLVNDLSVMKPEGRLELHLVGGFDDERRNSEDVSMDIFDALVRCDADIHLVTACIGEHNTVYKQGIPFPIIYGIAVDMETGRIFNATFPDHGPDQPLRSAYVFGGGRSNLLVYNWQQKQLSIGPFKYTPLRNIDYLLSLSNAMYRQYMSTSPAQEPESFENDVRACLQHMKDFPDSTALFQGNIPRCYSKLPNGKWEKA